MGGAVAPVLTIQLMLAWTHGSQWWSIPNDATADLNSWRPVMGLYGLAGIAGAGIFILLFRDWPHLHPAVNNAELRLIRGSEAVSTGSSQGSSEWPPILAMICSFPMWMNCAVQFSANLGWGFLVTKFPQFLKDTFGTQAVEVEKVVNQFITLTEHLEKDLRITRRQGIFRLFPHAFRREVFQLARRADNRALAIGVVDRGLREGPSRCEGELHLLQLFAGIYHGAEGGGGIRGQGDDLFACRLAEFGKPGLGPCQPGCIGIQRQLAADARGGPGDQHPAAHVPSLPLMARTTGPSSGNCS